MKQEQIEDLPLTVSAAMIDPSEDAVKLALSQIRRLIAEREALLGALKMVEWRGGMGEQHCSLCGCYSREWGDGQGHAGDCKLNAALALAES